MPALDALVDEFRAANTQVFGVSVDSIHCHANWAQSLGGVSFPLLADFHPKGQVASSYGLYLENAGITDRATVIIDAGGTVRYAHSVGPSGKRDMNELLAEAKKVDAAWDGSTDTASAPGVPSDAKLFVRSSCGFSAAALRAVQNLGISDLTVVNISEDEDEKGNLESLTGRTTAPCLVVDGEPLFVAKDIILRLAHLRTGL